MNRTRSLMPAGRKYRPACHTDSAARAIEEERRRLKKAGVVPQRVVVTVEPVFDPVVEGQSREHHMPPRLVRGRIAVDELVALGAIAICFATWLAGGFR